MITYVDAETKSRRTSGVIPLHGETGFAGMRKAGRLTAEALDILVDLVKPGVSTLELDRVAYEFARDNNAIPATLFYKGYRHSICTSINHVVCRTPVTATHVADFCMASHRSALLAVRTSC